MNRENIEKETNIVPPQQITSFAIIAVFLPFAGGYFLSFLYRSVNAIIADRLQADLGFGVTELGLITSAYFIAFASFQIPLGVLLDRFGPRRVNGTLLLIAAAGSGLFAIGESFLVLWLGRALIGLGVAGALMSAFKAITQWFPRRRWPLVNGCFMAMGGLGAISATAPVEAALQITDWRGIFGALSVVTVVVALVIFLVVPDKSRAGAGSGLKRQVSDLKVILTDRFFWRLAPVASLCMATSLSIQGLWAGPWLHDVANLPHSGVAFVLFLIACSMTVGFAAWGAITDFLERRGVELTNILAGGVLIYLLTVAVIVSHQTVDMIWPWVLFGFFGYVTSLSYSLVPRYFAMDLVGRANSTLNLLIFTTAFALQYGMGAILDFWATEADGKHPPVAYQVAFGVVLTACFVAWAWFIEGGRRTFSNKS